MARIAFCIAIFLSLSKTGFCQSDKKPDEQTFELTPSAPPTPALKHQLIFDDLADRRPGNAAILYLQAVLVMGPDAASKAAEALEAHESKDRAKFAALADQLELPQLFQQLDLAARRETCDWQPPFREMGAQTLLPHLGPLRDAARIIKARSLLRIDQARSDDALKTLRLGYELANKVGEEPILISGLVSIAITGMMNDALAQLMNSPQSPNLYWALSELPSRHNILYHAMEGERGWVVPTLPGLGPVKSGQQLSGAEWRALFKQIWEITDGNQENPPKHPDPVKDTSPEVLREAQQLYSQTYGLTPEQVVKLDPMIPIGHFFFRQFEIAFDETYKLRALPYPALLAKGKEQSQKINKQPANPFQVFPIDVIAMRFACVDRQIAALRAVEAVRSYAATHDGKLPARLDDVTDTPVPENPITGKPFEYRVDKDTAFLSDPDAQYPLTYTVRIRK